MSYHRFSWSGKKPDKYDDPMHPYVQEGKRKYYTRDSENVLKTITPPYPGEALATRDSDIPNLERKENKDGITLKTNMIPVTVKVENYTSDVQPEKRTTCISCWHHSGETKLGGGDSYRIWCKDAFAKGAPSAHCWKEEPYSLQDNRCRDWLPVHHDCINS